MSIEFGISNASEISEIVKFSCGIFARPFVDVNSAYATGSLLFSFSLMISSFLSSRRFCLSLAGS